MPRKEDGEPCYRISVDETWELLQQGDAVVIDVRRDDEWIDGHVSGAIHIPVDEVFDRIDELPTTKKLLFICASGVRSGLAAEMAASMDRDPETLYNVDEGTAAWIEKKYPTSYPKRK